MRVHLSPEDPRYLDLQRNVLAKLDRAMPNVSIVLAQRTETPATNSGDDDYGEVEYAYGSRSDVSRSTSPREILPLLYGLRNESAGTRLRAVIIQATRWLLPDGRPSLVLRRTPTLIACAWWRSRRPPRRTCLPHQKELNDDKTEHIRPMHRGRG